MKMFKRFVVFNASLPNHKYIAFKMYDGYYGKYDFEVFHMRYPSIEAATRPYNGEPYIWLDDYYHLCPVGDERIIAVCDTENEAWNKCYDWCEQMYENEK